MIIVGLKMSHAQGRKRPDLRATFAEYTRFLAVKEWGRGVIVSRWGR